MNNRTWLPGMSAALWALLGCSINQDPNDRGAEYRPARHVRSSLYVQSSTRLDPADIPKYVSPLVIPPAMPRTSKLAGRGLARPIDYYEIAVRQFQQQVLPPPLPSTTVWSYGSLVAPGTVAQGGSFHYPAFTIEAKYRMPVRVKWINDLVDESGNYLPHLLPVDQTLHWANPVGDCAMHPMMMHAAGPDCRGTSPEPYTGPVPMSTHVHGAATYEWSDGHPQAWYLPAATNIPPEILYTTGSFYELFKTEAGAFDPVPPTPGRGGPPAPYPIVWQEGSATYEYPNDQRASTLWYHDHALGMTRLNVYAGPAGFYLLRGGPSDEVLDSRTLGPAVLPGPAPALGDPPGSAWFEIPIGIQDRAFRQDGSLFYPETRAYFEGLEPDELRIPFIPEMGSTGMSDVSPIWNPEFFGNTIVVNGKTWPYHNVEPRRYRLRLLNGCDSRFLILQLDNPAISVWQIGSDGGYLPSPVDVNGAYGGRLLLAPAERADIIVDFSAAAGQSVTLLNLGPDEPFGGGTPGVDFESADPASTGQVMRFNVSGDSVVDPTTPAQHLMLPSVVPPGPEARVRRLSLNELESQTVFVSEEDGEIVHDPESGEAFGPVEALLGTLDEEMKPVPLSWSDPITENPDVGSTEVWEVYNFTMDAHPIHVHLVQFQVVNREGLMSMDGMAMQPAMLMGNPRGPEPGESGFKDTVIAYPGEVTRIAAKFDRAGVFVWHCHILSHEDNEMMRPFCVGTSEACMHSGMGH